jgi:hypothetical protein
VPLTTNKFASGPPIRERRVIRDASEWLLLRDTLGQAPLGGWPDVDFANEMVVVAGAGAHTYSTTIKVETAVVGPVDITVHVTTRLPDASCAYRVLNNVVDMVRIPRSDRPLYFDEREEVFSCTNQWYSDPAAFECPTTRPGADWSCAADGRWMPPGFPASSGQELRPLTLFVGHVEGHPRRLVIRDEVMWKAMWQAMHTGSSVLPPPQIDFSSEMLVVAGAGNQGPNASIAIEAVSVDATGLKAAVRTETGGCNAMPGIAAPVHIVRLPRIDLPVTFSERQNVRECPGGRYFW